MLRNEELYPNESGFAELNELLEQHVPSKQSPDYLSAPPVGVFGGGGFIKRVYENDSKDDEIVGSQVLVNRWVTQEILSLRTVGERRVLYISMGLIATGFALQAIGVLS